MAMDKNPRVSNSFRDFVKTGFNASYDHNMSQIIQNFVKDSTTLYTKMLEDNRGNVVNDSNYETLLKFLSEGFLSNQKVYGIKSGSVIIPLNTSLNNVSIGIDPVIPGFDKIRHFVKIDDNIGKPKKTITLLSKILKAYKLKEERDVEIENPRSWVDCMTRVMADGDDEIVPVSYCIPMGEVNPEENNTKSFQSLNNPETINVYTCLDKDDLYRILTMSLYNTFDPDDYKTLDYSNFRNFFRSIISKFLVKLNDRKIVTQLFDDCEWNKTKINMFRSAVGSVTKYYNNVCHHGMRGYIINKMRYYIKNVKESSTGWGEISDHQSYRNSLGVISGTRGLDFIFNYVIGELLAKKMFDKLPADQTSAIFEFTLSNSITYILTLASFSIGGSGYIEGVENIVGSSALDAHTDTRLTDTRYIDSLKEDYLMVFNDMFKGMASLIYGTFVVKYIYDFRKRMKDNQHVSVKEVDFVKNVLRFGTGIFDNGERIVRDIMESCTPAPQSEYGQAMPSANGCYSFAQDTNSGSIDDIKNPNGVFNHINNIRCRILNLETVYRITRYLRPISGEMYGITENLGNQHPVSGGEKVSYESDSGNDDVWAFGKMFSKTTPNLIDTFIKGENVGGNIKSYCDHLVSDVKFAIESEDMESLASVYKRTIILSNLSGKNISREDEEIVNDTLETVGQELASVPEVSPCDNSYCE
jgi:hypothetical protein